MYDHLYDKEVRHAHDLRKHVKAYAVKAHERSEKLDKELTKHFLKGN